MTLIADLSAWRWDEPKRRLTIFLAMGSACVLVVTGSAFWAFREPRLPPVPSSDMPVASVSPVPVATPRAGAWGARLWTPLSDTPVSAPSEQPFKTQLFSVMKRGGITIAALDLQDGNGLVYAKQGDTVGGYRIESIDDHGIQLLVNGHSQRLELGK